MWKKFLKGVGPKVNGKKIKVILLSSLMCLGMPSMVAVAKSSDIEEMDYESLLVHENEHGDDVKEITEVSSTKNGEYSFVCSKDGLEYHIIVPAFESSLDKTSDVTDKLENAALSDTESSETEKKLGEKDVSDNSFSVEEVLSDNKETKIVLSTDSLTIQTLDTAFSVTASVENSDNNIPFTWVSNHPEIVSVEADEFGNATLKAHKIGTAVITVRAEDGSTATAELKVTVSNLLNGLITNPTNEQSGTYYYENGILKNYLVDTLNGRRLNMPSTSSSRRQSYKFETTSRMTNTFLLNGKDFKHYVVAGHMPVSEYCQDIACFNPIINEQKHIISIDGGNRRDRQVHEFIICCTEGEGFCLFGIALHHSFNISASGKIFFPTNDKNFYILVILDLVEQYIQIINDFPAQRIEHLRAIHPNTADPVFNMKSKFRHFMTSCSA